MNKSFKLLAISVGVIVVGVAAFFLYSYFAPKSTLAPAPTQQTSTFQNTSSSGVSAITNAPRNTTGSTSSEPLGGPQSPRQKIFKIANGPIVSAVFVQYLNPTTTIARYVMQDSGHIFDQPIDVPGAVAQTVSNTTIPGIAAAMWGRGGNTLVLQYAENGTIKTVSLGLLHTSTTTNTAQIPISVRFLPNAISSFALSPDGKSIVYLIQTQGGVDGYTAAADGTSAKKIFSLPLQQMSLTWPAPKILLAQTKAAAGVPGIIFSISAQNGAYAPLVYTSGISATANASFSKIIYQTDASGQRLTYVHDTNTGKDAGLPFQPMPEKCVWGTLHPLLLLCAAPIASVSADFIDLWHQGVSAAADAVFEFNVATTQSLAVASPGSADGGERSDIVSLAVSQDERYLLYVTKGDRSLWGVRLTQ